MVLRDVLHGLVPINRKDAGSGSNVVEIVEKLFANQFLVFSYFPQELKSAWENSLSCCKSLVGPMEGETIRVVVIYRAQVLQGAVYQQLNF